MQHHLKHNRRFEQPWDGRPELGQCISKWMSGHIGHCIGPVFLKTAMCFSARESFRGDVLRRLCGWVRWCAFDMCSHNSLFGSLFCYHDSSRLRSGSWVICGRIDGAQKQERRLHALDSLLRGRAEAQWAPARDAVRRNHNRVDVFTFDHQHDVSNCVISNFDTELVLILLETTAASHVANCCSALPSALCRYSASGKETVFAPIGSMGITFRRQSSA